MMLKCMSSNVAPVNKVDIPDWFILVDIPDWLNIQTIHEYFTSEISRTYAFSYVLSWA